MAASSAPFEWSSFDAAPFEAPADEVMALALDHDDAMVGVARRAVGTLARTSVAAAPATMRCWCSRNW